jgi:ribosomal protein S18 acetylase RimI-like enzyme
MGLSQLRAFIEVAGWRALLRLTLLHIKTHRAHPSAAHYYLFAIGIAADAAGQGIGSALITHVLSRCDEEQMPAYLENSNPRNLHFYRKHGFRVLREICPTRNGPTLWLMWREPR